MEKDILLTEELIDYLGSGEFKEYEEKLKNELKEKRDIVSLIESEDLSIKKAADKLDSYFIFSVLFKKLAPEANDEILINVLNRMTKEGNVNIFSSELIKLLDEEMERFENVVIVENLAEKEAYISLYKDVASEEDRLFIVKTKEEIPSISETDLKTVTFAMKEEKVLKVYVEIFKERGIEVYLTEPIAESFVKDLENHKNS